MSQFVIGPRLDYLAEDGNRLLHLPLLKEGVAEVIASERIGRTNFQLGAKFRGGRFEIALTKVDESNEIVGFRETRIELQGGIELGERAGVIFLLRESLPKKKMNGGIVCILLQQAAENLGRQIRLTRSNESSSPSEEQAGIIRGLLEEGMKNFRGFGKVLRKEIAET